MAVNTQHIIVSNERYCFISNDTHDIVINQCLAYDWKRNAILSTINIQINHRIQNQFFLQIILNIEIIICTINTQNDIKQYLSLLTILCCVFTAIKRERKRF